jgi:hypothetical protein
MINLNYSVKLSALLTVGSLSVGSLSAQFFQANALEAQAYGGVIDQGFVAVSAASDFAVASISSGSGFFGAYNYDTYDTDSLGANRAFEADIEQNAVQVAYVHDFDALLAGLAFTYFDTEMTGDYSNAGNVGEVEAEGDGWIFSLSAAHSWGSWTALVTGGYGSLSQDSSRRSKSAFVGESSADFDSDLAFVTVELNYDFQVSDTVEVSPFVQFNYQDVSIDSFSEAGAAADAGVLDSIERDWITGELGVRSVLTFSESLSALASLSWEHDFESDDVALSGDSQGLSTPGSIDVSTVGDSRFKASLSIVYMIDEQWAISAGVDVSSGDDVDAFGGGLVLNRSF